MYTEYKKNQFDTCHVWMIANLFINILATTISYVEGSPLEKTPMWLYVLRLIRHIYSYTMPINLFIIHRIWNHDRCICGPKHDRKSRSRSRDPTDHVDLNVYTASTHQHNEEFHKKDDHKEFKKKTNSNLDLEVVQLTDDDLMNTQLR